MEDTRLTKAADLAAKQHVLLASDVLDAWKRPQLKAVRRQLRHWTKNVRQPFGAPATSPGEDDFDAVPVQSWLTQLVKTAQGKCLAWGTLQTRQKTARTTQTRITPSAKKKLRFAPQVSTEE